MGQQDDSGHPDDLELSQETGLPLLPGGVSDELIEALARASLGVGDPDRSPSPPEEEPPDTPHEVIDLAEVLAETEAHEAARQGDVEELWDLLRNPIQADRTAEQLIHRIDSIRERTIRPRAIQEFLYSLTDPMLLATLHRILARARRGEAGARAALQELALDTGILGSMPRERAWRLVGLAQRVGIDELPPLLMPPVVDKRRLPVSGPDNEFLQLPLGLRRQAARTTDRNLIDRLLRDPDHRVIANLLDNPRLREQDVVTIAARRPNSAKVLRVVSRHQRWSSRYRVRKALTCNPHTPAEIATRLLSTLLVQDLRFIVSSGVLLPEVQQEAVRVLERRSG